MRYDEVIIGGMGEGFNVLNAKIGQMIEQELNARKNVDEKINEINETNKIDDNSKHIEYDK